MTERGARWLAGVVMVVAGLVAGFLAGGLTAAALAGGDTGLAGAATVALAAVGAAVVVALLSAWLASRAARRLLLPLALLLVTTALTLALVTSAVRRQESPPADPLATSAPVTVTGGDSLLALLRLGTVADGSGLLPSPLDLRGGPGDSADVLTTVTRWSDLIAEEIGYEEPAIAVFRVSHPWYLVATRDSVFGWVRLPDGASVVALVDLLPDRLTYLTSAWDGTLHAVPGAAQGTGVPGLVRDHGEASVVVHEARLVADALWLHVAVHRESPCETGGEPEVIAEGWVRAWTEGRPTVWYYSRGC